MWFSRLEGPCHPTGLDLLASEVLEGVDMVNDEVEDWECGGGVGIRQRRPMRRIRERWSGAERSPGANHTSESNGVHLPVFLDEVLDA